MKKVILLTVLILIIFSLQISHLYSGLDDFKHDFKKEESQKSKGSNDRHPSSSGIECSCFDMIMAYFVKLWIDVNLDVRYNKYPYQFLDSNNFIFYIEPSLKKPENRNDFKQVEINKTKDLMNTYDIPDKSSDTEKTKHISLNKGTQFEDKNYYFTIEGGYQYAFDNGNGIFATLRGKFYKLIGPEIEAKRIIDNHDHLDYYAFGLNIPIVQFSGFLPDFYFQKIFLKGIIDRDGYAYGLIINSYPIKPISLMVRIGEQSYNNIKGKDYGNIKFMDYEGRIGVIYNRFEIYVGYRHIKAEYAKIEGPEFGIKIFI
jgi:hypothetical protein